LVKKLDEVSPYLINAFLSVEDHEFYQHKGIVPSSLIRATWQQVSGSEVTTGGSTITQQLVKNELFTQEKSLERKALEIINALRIEKYYNKEQIFVAYMNSVYFGKGAHGKHMYGVVAAARGIFNKDVKELNLAQAAYIAGMVQRPNAYNPLRGEENIKLGTKRMKLVLLKMLENKKITESEYDKAVQFDIKSSLAKQSDFENPLEKYPYIMTATENEAVDILMAQDKVQKNEANYKEYRDRIKKGGYKIYTTVDEQLYNALNDSIKNMNVPGKWKKGKKVKEQIGATLVDNKTGAVLAFVSGTDFKETQLDHAFEVERQPGSAIKPLLVYGPALNEGLISPDSMIWDEPVLKPNGTPYKNANGKYKNGPVTATYALQWSLNTPTIKLIRKLGVEHAFDYLRKMDMPPHKWDGEASALGGMRQGYTVAQMTAAYAMIANQGNYNKPHLIERIEDSAGNVIYDFSKQNKTKQILSPQATYQLTQMMREVVRDGTAKVIGGQTGGYNIAGKTGTTSNYVDLWFVGFTPEVSLGVWSGYDQHYSHAHETFTKAAWSRLFKAAAKTKPDLIKAGSNFNNPGGLTSGKCFECGRALPAPEPQPGQQPAQPGQQPAQPGQQPVQPGQQPAQPGQQPAQPGQPTGEQPQTEQPTGNPQQPPTTGDGGQSQ
jgi:penicillin-binding protein 1B